MKSLLLFTQFLLVCVVAGAEEDQTTADLHVTVSGRDHPEAFPLEEIAAGVFGGLADMEREDPGSGKRFLENRFDLGSEAIDKLIDAATEAQSQQPVPRARAKEICNELRKLKTREEYLVVLRTTYAQDLAQENLYGAKLLESLDPKDRAKVISVLEEEIRPSMTKSTLDFERLLDHLPRDQYKERVCDAAHLGE